MAESFNFDPTILREYDVRGIVGESLTEEVAYYVGRSFGTQIREEGGKKACVGYDGRESSPGLAAAVVRGFVDCGLEAVEVGMGPTPMLYYAVHALDADGGLMLTGSHNPPNYNGFKMLLGKKAVFGSQIRALGDIAGKGAFAEGQGASRQEPMLNRYVERILQDFHGGKPLKVAWDAGNGSAGEAMRMVTEKLPGEHVLLYADIDGTFPNHHPDPTVAKNLVDLQKAVKDAGCDLGIAFDGDGDRIGVIDSQGRILWGDQLILILAREVLAAQPGATIIADVKASQTLFDGLAKMGGTPMMWRTGHSLIKAKMAEVGSPLAGEMSGHIFYADKYYGYDDALYVALRLLGIVSRAMAQDTPESIDQMLDAMPPVVNTPEMRFECPEERKFKVIEEVQQRLRDAGADMSDIDGVRVRSGSGWWLLRASNTQAVLVARCEASNEEELAALRADLAKQLELSGVKLPDGDCAGGH